MKVWVEFDEGNDVWTITPEDCVLNSVESVAEWRGQLLQGLEALDQKADIFVDMSGIHIDPAVGAEYGAVAKAVVGDYASTLFRYGSPDGMTLASVRLQSIIKAFSSNIFQNRAAALAALEFVRDSEHRPT